MSSASDTARAELAQKLPAGFLEGVDFIETEEDAKAVEAATLKIQSTFRGKKFRLKQSDKSPSAPKTTDNKPDDNSPTAAGQDTTSKGCHLTGKSKQVAASEAAPEETNEKTTTTTTEKQETELSKKVSEMQVNEQQTGESTAPPTATTTATGGTTKEVARKSSGPNVASGLPEEEVERAATKIQAGFKGYKTRKELEEGRLATGSAGAQQAAPKESTT